MESPFFLEGYGGHGRTKTFWLQSVSPWYMAVVSFRQRMLQQACQHQFSVYLHYNPGTPVPLVQFHAMFLYPVTQKASPISSFFHSMGSFTHGDLETLTYLNTNMIGRILRITPNNPHLFVIPSPVNMMIALQWLCCYMAKTNTADIIKVSPLK